MVDKVLLRKIADGFPGANLLSMMRPDTKNRIIVIERTFPIDHVAAHHGVEQIGIVNRMHRPLEMERVQVRHRHDQCSAPHVGECIDQGTPTDIIGAEMRRRRGQNGIIGVGGEIVDGGVANLPECGDYRVQETRINRAFGINRERLGVDAFAYETPRIAPSPERPAQTVEHSNRPKFVSEYGLSARR